MLDHGDPERGQTRPPSSGFVLIGFGQSERAQIVKFAAHIVQGMVEMEIVQDAQQDSFAGFDRARGIECAQNQ
jgi:hypothetical protein